MESTEILEITVFCYYLLIYVMKNVVRIPDYSFNSAVHMYGALSNKEPSYNTNIKYTIDELKPILIVIK